MLLCMAGSVSAQIFPPAHDSTSVPYRLGIFGGLGPSLQFVDLVVPTYDPFCGSLPEGSGAGWDVGGIMDLPFSDLITFHGRLGIMRETGSMRHVGDPFPIRNAAGDVVDGQVDQLIEFKSTGIEAGLTGSMQLIAGLHGELGLGAWFRLFTEQFHYQEAVNPSELLLNDNTRKMELTRGTLFESNPVVPLALMGVRYDMPIGEASYLSPELRLSYPLISWTPEGSWRSLRVSFGGAVRFGFPGAPHDPVIVQVPDTLPPPPPVLVPDVVTAPEVVMVQITEYDSTDWVPVLNRVFFDEGSSVIPGRYAELDLPGTFDFSPSDLTGPTIDVYHNMLNIIGRRMQTYPDAELAVTGYRNGTETDPELGMERARAVKDYLTNVWDVLADRIVTNGEGLPPKPVLERSAAGREENSMAELVPTNPNVIRPVQRNYILRVANPPGVTFYPRIIAEAGLRAWQLEVFGEEGLWKRFSGGEELPDSIHWDWRSDSGALPSLPLTLAYRLSATDTTGQTRHTDRTSIQVRMSTIKEKLEHREQDTLIESYSLLLFEYDSPKISDADRSLIRAIASRVKSSTSVRFTGYTDSLGDARRNRELGRQRAENAAEIFRSYAPEDVDITINPDGGERERFPYDTPEGRSYDRTVVIEVRTPIVRSGE